MGDLAGTVVVVTGAAGGIGSAVATAFEGAGASVFGIHREQAELTQADEVVRAFGVLNRFAAPVNAAGISGRSLGDGPVEPARRRRGTPCSTRT